MTPLTLYTINDTINNNNNFLLDTPVVGQNGTFQCGVLLLTGMFTR